MNVFRNIPVFDIEAAKNVDTIFVFELETEDDAEPNLSGYTATAKFRADATGSLLFTNNPTVSGNKVAMTITTSESNTYFGTSNRLAFSVQLTQGGENVPIAVGIITVKPFTF